VAQEVPESQWITVKEMQQVLSLSRSKAYEIVSQEDEIETVQIGRAVRINKASLERWVRKQRYLE
jgi:excisionase family DNA binding protein